jgi:hypothetical protein
VLREIPARAAMSFIVTFTSPRSTTRSTAALAPSDWV